MICFKCGKSINGTGKTWVIASRVHCYWNHILECKVRNFIPSAFKTFLKIREEGNFDNTKLLELAKKHGIEV